MRIAVIACDTLRTEISRLVEDDPDISEVVYLESALHIDPRGLRTAVAGLIDSLVGRADAVFLGYGRCRSLSGIEVDAKVPTVLPQYDDCISILLTPHRRRAEIEKEAGTWFMSPGWAGVDAGRIVRELGLDRAGTYGRDPMDMAKRLFTHYKRGLFFNTGIPADEVGPYREQAKQFCSDFSLEYEETEVADPPILREELERCKRLAAGQAKPTD
jgi:hypothetical protein